jgi:hypothetical protein
MLAPVKEEFYSLVHPIFGLMKKPWVRHVRQEDEERPPW